MLELANGLLEFEGFVAVTGLLISPSSTSTLLSAPEPLEDPLTSTLKLPIRTRSAKLD